jgi:hypothetical protein
MQARLLTEGVSCARRGGMLPNLFITIRFGETFIDLTPFAQLQLILERLRKLTKGRPFICFWVREREPGDDVVEHAHIAVLLRRYPGAKVANMLAKWLGSVPAGNGAIDVRECGHGPGYDAVSLVGGYFLKGGSTAVRARYLSPGQRRRWRPNQGALIGKRAGVSQYVGHLIHQAALTVSNENAGAENFLAVDQAALEPQVAQPWDGPSLGPPHGIKSP